MPLIFNKFTIDSYSDGPSRIISILSFPLTGSQMEHNDSEIDLICRRKSPVMLCDFQALYFEALFGVA